jgi:hypothetical protein
MDSCAAAMTRSTCRNWAQCGLVSLGARLNRRVSGEGGRQVGSDVMWNGKCESAVRRNGPDSREKKSQRAETGPQRDKPARMGIHRSIVTSPKNMENESRQANKHGWGGQTHGWVMLPSGASRGEQRVDETAPRWTWLEGNLMACSLTRHP